MAMNPERPQLTQSQLFWRKMFDSGDILYGKEVEPIKTEAWDKAVDELLHDFPTFVSHFNDHILAIDKDFRGRDAGTMKERYQRAGMMLGMIGLFVAFDYTTSWPWRKLADTKKFKLKEDTKPFKNRAFNATRNGTLKLIEVINDKFSTMLADSLVNELTGLKEGFVREPADKMGDVGNIALKDKLQDLVNGPVFESLFRYMYQVPIYGALFERGMRRMTQLQETSVYHKNTGKAFYMALGEFIATLRGIK